MSNMLQCSAIGHLRTQIATQLKRFVMRRLIGYFLVLSVLGLTGCNAVVDKTYRPAVGIGDDQKDFFVKPSSSSEVRVERLKFDGQIAEMSMISKYPDYRIVGRAGFKVASVSDSELKQKAQDSGASLVVLIEKWEGTVQSGTVANAVPLQGGGAFAIATPIMSDKYEFLALFMAKYVGGKDRIGVGLGPLSGELQQKLERNKGVVVAAINPRGPAFDASILLGDVIIKVNESDVLDLTSGGELIRKACKNGPPILIDVLRGTEAREKRITVTRCE